MFSIGRRVAALLLPRIEGSSHRRLVLPVTYLIVPLVLLILVAWPGGCASSTTPTSPALTSQPIIRVKLAKLAPEQAHFEQVQIAATQPPTYYTSSDPTRKVLNIRDDSPFPLSLGPAGWKVGGTVVGTGELIIIPASPKTFSINGRKYRGEYHAVAVTAAKFDIVNHVAMEEYLRGLAELPGNFQEETFKAQVIAARTYALYEKSYMEKAGSARHFDVFDGQQSQCYEGLAGESEKADRAVNETAGIVLAYGQPGAEHIFKTYYSSSCGGVSQSVVYVFNEPFIEPLGDQDNHNQCNISGNSRFNWGPIVIAKRELTRRFKSWGAKRNRPEKDMALITRVEVKQSNAYNRPVRFQITDADGKVYSLSGEELRQATNTEAAEGTILLSSFVNVISDSDAIRFVDGHGWGHGVGMCQWCAEARARLGWRHEDILQAAYPRSTRVRAY